MGEARRRRLLGNVAIWKTPMGAVEEVDQIMALQRAAEATMAVESDSLDYWSGSSRVGATVAEWENRVEKWAALLVGNAHVRLPDNTRWICCTGLMRQSDGVGEGAGDNRFLQRLVALLLRHQRLHGHPGPRLPSILMRQDTLAAQRVFCTDCHAWCDLQADAEEADRLEEQRRGKGRTRRNAG